MTWIKERNKPSNKHDNHTGVRNGIVRRRSVSICFRQQKESGTITSATNKKRDQIRPRPNLLSSIFSNTTLFLWQSPSAVLETALESPPSRRTTPSARQASNARRLCGAVHMIAVQLLTKIAHFHILKRMKMFYMMGAGVPNTAVTHINEYSGE